MTEEGNRPSHRPLDVAQATKLLDLLIDDEAFREQFTHDWRGALASIGYPDSDMETIQCAKVTTLAPREELIKVREALREQLTSSAMMAMTVVFCFEAGQTAGQLKKPS